MREYVWLPETEIAPTASSRAPIDRPIAVVDGVGGIYFSLTALFARLTLAAPARARPSGRFALLLPRRWSLARLV